MANEQRPQGGTLDDESRPNGHGSPSNDAPNLPNPQAVKVSGDVTPRKRK